VDSLGSDEKWRNLVGLRYDDILDAQQFLARVEADALPGIDAIIHLGACSATTERDAGFLLRNNYQYTQTLCEWSVRHGARFIYASSAATYGDGSKGYDDDPAKLEQLEPLNMYGYSKHMFDLWAQRHGLLDRIVGMKYFNVYGPNEDHKGDMRSVVEKSYGQIKSVGMVKLFKSYKPEYADGEQLRDFIFVKDAVAMTLYFLENRGVSGIFNCGTGQARSWKALATAVFTAMNIPPRIEFIEMPETLKGKYQYFTQAEMKRMRAAGYSAPFTSLEEGVRQYVTDYLAVRGS
jgi:ADP-L-glycero-D-manno-heptose 6-epimerase